MWNCQQKRLKKSVQRHLQNQTYSKIRAKKKTLFWTTIAKQLKRCKKWQNRDKRIFFNVPTLRMVPKSRKLEQIKLAQWKNIQKRDIWSLMHFGCVNLPMVRFLIYPTYHFVFLICHQPNSKFSNGSRTADHSFPRVRPKWIFWFFLLKKLVFGRVSGNDFFWWSEASGKKSRRFAF